MTTHTSPARGKSPFAKLSLWKSLLVGVGLALASVCAVSASGATKTWLVDVLHDGSPDATHTTLRTAIAAAGDGDIIGFSPELFVGDLPKTLTLSQGTLAVAKNITIDGPGDAGATHVPMLQIAGNGSSRLFLINSTANVTISGIGMRKGIGAGGGGILIAPDARLTLFECDITDCAASGNGAGGAILNQGSLTMDLCLVARNTAYDGAGIASSGSVQIARSLIQDNVATNAGGGINSGAALFTLESSTVTGNKAGTGGGIVVIASGKTPGAATLRAATVVGNRASNQAGGLYVEGSAAVATVGGSLFTANGLVNTSGAFTPRDLAVQKSGKINSADYNIVSKPGTTFSPYLAHDQVNIDPQLGPLVYAGGRTLTYQPATTSSAIDRGNPAFSGVLVPTDQRGLPRVSPQPGGIADVGAVEVSGPSLALPAEYEFECTGALTTGTLKAVLTLPGGGTASVTWTINGVAGAATMVTVPNDGAPVDLTQSGQFNFGSNSASVKVVAAGYGVTRSTLVTIKDSTAPVISLTGPSPATIEWSTLYSDAGATVTDVCDPAPVLTTTLPFPSGQVYPVGTYSIIYKATDASGNTSTATRVLHVVDSTKPVITPVGTNPIVVEYGSIYVDAGATATDNHDGALTVTIDASAVNTGTLGNYVVNFMAKDAAGNTATATRTVRVTDTTRPVITLAGTSPAYVEWSTPYQDAGASATDAHDGPIAVITNASTVNTALLGSYTVSFIATDSSGNTATASRTVVVRDTTPPVITLQGASPLSLDWGTLFTDPGASANDNHDGSVPVTAVASPVNTCIPGQYDVTYTAQDAAGNTATSTRVVTVVNTVTLSVDTVSQAVDPALGTAGIDLSKAIAGMQVTPCSAAVSYSVTIKQLTSATGEPETYKTLAELKHLSALPTYQFPAGTSTVRIEVALEGLGQPLLDDSFTVQVTDPYNVTLTNVAWPLALDLPTTKVPANGRITLGTFRQMIARSGESRWFRIHGAPGSNIQVTLKNLPANFDLVVYSDIEAAFAQLLEQLGSSNVLVQKQALLGAQSAQEAYLQEAYLQEAYLQEAYLQEAYLQEAYLQEAYLPESYFQEAYLPETYSQEAYLQEAYLQEAYLQEAYLPEAFSTAQLKSLVSFSAAPGTANENVRFNTYSSSGDFYIRVRGNNGLYSHVAPFELDVQMVQDLAANITDLNTTPATVPSVPASTRSLLIWDSARIPGTTAEKAALASSLAAFAQVANGFVLDIASDSRVSALNAQADANTAVPLAKNLVAETIRNLILRCRSSAPLIGDITLIGSDNVIPFFRTNDNAQLAGEFNYYPPVKDGTHSQSSLRLNQVLTQDRYGSTTQLSLVTGPYDVPDLPVGRLVESAAEVGAYLGAYAPLFNGTATSGTLPTPHSAFVSGYEFLADSATEMRDDFAAGLGGGATVDTLISAVDVPPALGWTADQLRAAFLGSRYDIAYLGGHFSGGGTLAADYKTRMTAKEMNDSAVNLQYSLVLSTGCHSGYNTIDGDSITLLTEQPDWAQAFSRKKALWISGTGYQYGDTDFVEYTERLQLEVARALRTGTGPISIGQAFTNAKRRYLADTAVMRGIHVKTLLQLTLYGLPMVRINVPGTRLDSPGVTSDVASATPVAGTGAPHGLKTGEVTLNPVLTRVDRTLDVLGTTDTIVASYYTGSDGFVSIPGEPVRALESLNISRPNDGLVRGIGFRGGEYSDTPGFLPFVGVPVTEASGIHGRFYSEVFYPVGIWSLNQAGELDASSAGSRLNVFPTQFISDGAQSATGIVRKFGQIKFTVFYCPDRSVTALANSPALNLVSSTVSGNQVSFDIEAATAKDAGVQEVWITYTGLPGSSLHGTWRSLTLTAPADPTGIGHWTGTLPLSSAAEVANLRYIVQAVNGVGAVVASTNFGRFYRAGTSTQDAVAPKLPANLALQGPISTTATYRESVAVQARLVDQSGAALAGRTVRFSIGAAIRSALTDSNGLAATSLKVNTRPGSYRLEASFAGDATHGNATDSQAFAVTKLGTQLTPTTTTLATRPSGVTFDLIAADGSPVLERTVVVLLKNGPVTTAVSVITDGIGRARLPDTGIASGTYLITAYFAQPVLLPNGETVSLDDPLYGPAQASTTITVVSTLNFLNEQAWLNYSDQTAAGASASNRGLTKAEIAGDMKANDSAFKSSSILAANKANTVTATLQAVLSGKTIAAGTIILRAQSSDRLHWRGDAVISGVSVQLYVDWDGAGGTGKYHVWINPAAGTGPLYGEIPAILTFDLILGTGTGERPAGGASRIGGPDKPWTQENPNSRSRSSN